MATDGNAKTEQYDCIGTSPHRLDVKSKVTGNATFIEDMQFRGMLYGKVKRSKYAHARIVSIDTSKAEELPGVKGVVLGSDLPFLHGEALRDRPLLARGRVRYLGEPVAAVAAINETIAEEAVELIEVQYEELPGLFDPEKSVQPDAPLIHEELDSYVHAPGINPLKGTNICNHYQLQKGDVEKGFAESDHIFEDAFTTGAVQHAFIEPHGAICLVDDDDRMTLWANNDSPYRCRKEIANAMSLPTGDIRIICPAYIGGNYGGKGGLQAEALAIALAWKIRNRPIRVMYTREEEFCSALVRHPSKVYIKTGVKKDGTILARQVKMYYATGAYAEKGPTVSRFGGVSGAGPYNIPSVHIESYCVYTNKQISGAMRGYSGPQGAWSYESHMDNIAHALGFDPLELRLRHIYKDGDSHTSGQVLYSEGIEECLKKTAERMGWDQKPTKKNRGRGLACIERAVKTPFGSAAFVKVNEDGTVEVLSSTTEVGQGSETVLCQIVAEELGIPLSWVRKATPDTAFTPYDSSTTSSRSTFHMGNAVKFAAADAREQIVKMAAETLEANPDDLKIKVGNVFVTGAPQKALPIGEVLRRHLASSGTVLGKGWYYPETPDQAEYFSNYMIFWILGSQGVEVEVDTQTGEVEIIKIYAAMDVGKAIHPSNCEGQTEGGVSMGLGLAMYEDYMYKDGAVLNPNYLSYKLPSILEMPEVESILVECHHKEGPYGAKGPGECTNVATPPAIANAIFDAVGIRIKDLPITPDKVLKALKEKAQTDKA
jgi:carbon-monoxide dehydrogenase large subunit